MQRLAAASGTRLTTMTRDGSFEMPCFMGESAHPDQKKKKRKAGSAKFTIRRQSERVVTGFGHGALYRNPRGLTRPASPDEIQQPFKLLCRRRERPAGSQRTGIRDV